MKIINCIMEFLDEATKFAFIRNQIEELRCRPFFKTDSYEEIKNSYREYIESDFKEILLQYEDNVLLVVSTHLGDATTQSKVIY